jgi:hypothetical protein
VRGREGDEAPAQHRPQRDRYSCGGSQRRGRRDVSADRQDAGATIREVRAEIAGEEVAEAAPSLGGLREQEGVRRVVVHRFGQQGRGGENVLRLQRAYEHVLRVHGRESCPVGTGTVNGDLGVFSGAGEARPNERTESSARGSGRDAGRVVRVLKQGRGFERRPRGRSRLGRHDGRRTWPSRARRATRSTTRRPRPPGPRSASIALRTRRCRARAGARTRTAAPAPGTAAPVRTVSPAPSSSSPAGPLLGSRVPTASRTAPSTRSARTTGAPSARAPATRV